MPGVDVSNTPHIIPPKTAQGRHSIIILNALYIAIQREAVACQYMKIPADLDPPTPPEEFLPTLVN